MLNFVSGSNPTIHDCKFTHNSAGNGGHGGGMANNYGASPTVTNCVFTRNFAPSNGGGMYNFQGSPTVIGCTFFGNVASQGGGMLNHSSGANVINCLFSGNFAYGPLGGGGLWRGVSTVGLRLDLISNCTFAGNSAATDGGGVWIDNGDINFDNCIFWNNDDTGGVDESAQIYVRTGTVAVSSSDIDGSWSGPGMNNINANPLFVDPDGDNFRLQCESPCIDAADNVAVPFDVADLDGDMDTSERTPLDLDGGPRFVDDPATPDTGADDLPDYPNVVDMGAYEFQSPPTNKPNLPPEDAHAVARNNRYLSIIPQNAGQMTALRVTLISSTDFPAAVPGSWWVGPPATFCENSGQSTPPPGGCGLAPGLPSQTGVGAQLQCTPHCMDWGSLGLLHVSDSHIVPSAVYEVRAIDCSCDTTNPANFSPPETITTSLWGDLVQDCTVCPCPPPEGSVDVVTDVTATLNKFQNLSCAPITARADVEPMIPDREINISDVTFVLNAFGGAPYPFGPPVGCP